MDTYNKRGDGRCVFNDPVNKRTFPLLSLSLSRFNLGKFQPTLLCPAGGKCAHPHSLPVSISTPKTPKNITRRTSAWAYSHIPDISALYRSVTTADSHSPPRYCTSSPRQPARSLGNNQASEQERTRDEQPHPNRAGKGTKDRRKTRGNPKETRYPQYPNEKKTWSNSTPTHGKDGQGEEMGEGYMW
jgi:hypothetical protein